MVVGLGGYCWDVLFVLVFVSVAFVVGLVFYCWLFLFGLCWVRLGFWVGFFVVFIMLCCCVVVLCFGFCFVILDLFCCWFSWLFCGVGWCFVVGLWVGCGGGGWLGFVCFF